VFRRRDARREDDVLEHVYGEFRLPSRRPLGLKQGELLHGDGAGAREVCPAEYSWYRGDEAQRDTEAERGGGGNEHAPFIVDLLAELGVGERLPVADLDAVYAAVEDEEFDEFHFGECMKGSGG